MADPVGLIGAGGAGGLRPGVGPVGPTPAPGSPSFKEILVENLREVDELQQDATRAIEDLASGRRSDVDGVILATQKADTAFKMLQAMRNKVMAAYDELKQMRV